ncbi:DUF4214 domain-containing protein [Subtercola boreus]|nr:DUF4214 domain-containing protein [Subtercola boreus]
MKRLVAAVAAVLMVAGLTTALAPAASAAPAPARAAYVTALYQDYLGRLPSNSDVTFWSAKLAAGSPRSSVAAGFADSDEYRLIRIDNAYRTILGREPEAGGRASWLDGMHRGILGTDDVDRAFYQSDEFYINSGNSDWTVIAALYQHILGRTPSFEESSTWLTRSSHLSFPPGPGTFPTYGLDRPLLVTSIYGSTEAARDRVSVMYSTYFHRAPDASGVVAWGDFNLANGDAATRSGLTSSDEYYALAGLRYP